MKPVKGGWYEITEGAYEGHTGTAIEVFVTGFGRTYANMLIWPGDPGTEEGFIVRKRASDLVETDAPES